ncbi:MAG: DUF58 domain-containing protein [Treponema sp.]|jgi:hypothetical protein|nr:DUF58 domain-containing protein [Treponema sp.]
MKQITEPIPRPQCMGLFFLLFALLAFIAGQIRNELVLTLLGVLFFTVLGYSFLGTLAPAILLSKRIRSVSIRIVSKHIATGKGGEFLFIRGLNPGSPGRGRGGFFFRPLGILIRYGISLATRDGRRIFHIFDPDALKGGFGSFTVAERGAYYGAHDEFLILDTLGFFRVSFHIPQETGARLLAAPRAAAAPIPVTVRSGGLEQRTEPHFQRTENLIDHRPYVPGDDPRRINWKLYGHAGDLFVREGEPEPPPHSRLLILVDTQVDPALYTPEAGRRGVDLLCENAMAAILEYSDREGTEVLMGYTSGDIRGGNAAELADALAYPAALPFSPVRRSATAWGEKFFPAAGSAGIIEGAETGGSVPEELPRVSDRGILILALPRAGAETSALDRFLKKRIPQQNVEILFLYEGDFPEKAAETCVSIYRQKGGVHARSIRL